MSFTNCAPRQKAMNDSVFRCFALGTISPKLVQGQLSWLLRKRKENLSIMCKHLFGVDEIGFQEFQHSLNNWGRGQILLHLLVEFCAKFFSGKMFGSRFCRRLHGLLRGSHGQACFDFVERVGNAGSLVFLWRTLKFGVLDRKRR